MAIGLGKRYLVELIAYFTGSLEECLEWMKTHKPRDNKEWYELETIKDIKKQQIKEYTIQIVRFYNEK